MNLWFKLEYIQNKKIFGKTNLSVKIYINPNEPAVNPTAQKKENSRRSLGRELTINLNWVI